MKWLCALLMAVAACGTDVNLDGIWQYSISGDIASSQNGYCLAGALSGSGQVQIAGADFSFGANVNTGCNAGGEACDSTPCYYEYGWNCTYASNGDATCDPTEDNTMINSAFVLGKCSMDACTMTGGPYANVTDVTLELTRQR